MLCVARNEATGSGNKLGVDCETDISSRLLLTHGLI